jgi:hypothetical protein
MLYLDVFFSVALVAFWVYCVLDVLVTDRAAVRNLPKLAWVFIVLLIYPIGAAAWLIAGRPRAGTPTPSEDAVKRPGPRWPVVRIPNAPVADRPRRDRSRAPDDDPEFLAGLSGKARESGQTRESRSDEQLLRDWEADLRRREDRLRDDDGDGEPPATV